MSGVRFDEKFTLNSRGLKLYTCRWSPTTQEPRAMVFLCHGYAMESAMTMNETGNRLARAGFAVYGIDYQGHGKSAGLDGYVHNFDEVVNDCSDYFTKICGKRENNEKKKFLLGESMGGAVVLLLHRMAPEFYDGAILVAPMCKIADEVKPSPLMICLLIQLSKIVPTWKLIPSSDITDLAIHDESKREKVRSNPYCYKGRLRLKTGNELLRVSEDIERHLPEVKLPLLVLHGEADEVTDIAVSRRMCEVASSEDKTFKSYPGMWHSLIFGELPHNIDIVFSDILDWLHYRSVIPSSGAEWRN